jgi:diadenosine tetraphosphate (Ap4A) HIT family hydrolase
VYESRTWFVRFDNYPATPGHVELVPRRHVVSLFDLTRWEALTGWRLLLKTRAFLLAEYCPDGFNVGVNDGRTAGRSIDHLHIHVIPRHFGDQEDPRGGFRRGLPNGDPDVWTAAITRKDHEQ